ncbi:MAG: BACON domain-containing protein, partial [Alistipes sp.]|nr:BACON domain-containing protein [Alistipes sp.]
MKHLRQCLWAAALVAGIAMTGCKEDDATVEPVVEAPELEVIGAESGYAFAYYDGEDKAKTFTVYATAPWTIQKDGGWFVCEPASGRAGEETRVTLTVVENDGAARTGNVTVVANAGTFKHPVTAEYAFSLTQTA